MRSLAPAMNTAAVRLELYSVIRPIEAVVQGSTP